MVRIKERYLLVNILYPTELGTRANLPDVVVLNQPTTDELTPVVLLRAIRAEVAALFGDYGSGALEGGGFSGKSSPISVFPRCTGNNRRYSQVPLASHFNFHPAHCASLLSIRLDSPEFHELSPREERQAVRVPSRSC
ncbi:hypothetical protein F4859DRAFT_518671 [Xylaria cf. heliscus]|nr:hypothetical protein F4859DRAFT_518671 [Xylaria cf. heliscus]